MDRGIQASIKGIEIAKQAFKTKGWTQDYLAGFVQCSRQTVGKFFARQPIEKRIFQAICVGLEKEWGDIAELEPDEKPDRLPNIYELVEIVRINIYDSIQTKCGTMRVLDMAQPIDLNAIYTNVNILEKITGRQRLEYQDLIQSCSLENFDRFSLSGVQEARIPALDAVDKYAKLMILGKPGAGKTTFLKYVALQCIEGIFKPHLIPLFITLKDFAEADNQPSLLDYIIQLFKSYGIEPDTRIDKGFLKSLFDDSNTPVEFLLREGRFSILLDGLDEVSELDNKRVLQQIQDFSDLFANNLFAITCRIAAREYTFEKFTEVEVADFDDQQIATFTQQWFQTKSDPVKAENFIKKLNQEPGIRELASIPLLLTLLCLAFGESGNFPANRSELYKEGLDVLMKKWDAKRNIERNWVYKNLSTKRKEDLLSQIARDTFEQEKYFFKQKEVERYITQYIRNLPNANIEEDTLQLDSEAVLKSIESQHGLLVERARGIYSFSHLTFHEYFTARKIVSSANSDILVQKLAAYVTQKRWREVFLLTGEMIENADLLLRAMKQEIDSILAQDMKFQKFLSWAEEKSHSTKSNYKSAAVRAYFVNRVNESVFGDHEHDLADALDRAIALAGALALNRIQSIEALTDALDHVEALDKVLAEAITDLDADRSLTIPDAFETIELHELLQQIKNQLPDTSLGNCINLHNWWKANGQVWADQLKVISEKYRVIHHDWQFSEYQKKLLQQYYDANKLLVDCLNSDCYLSQEVRSEIESTLFLPIASIHKLKAR